MLSGNLFVLSYPLQVFAQDFFLQKVFPDLLYSRLDTPKWLLYLEHVLQSYYIKEYSIQITSHKLKMCTQSSPELLVTFQ